MSRPGLQEAVYKRALTPDEKQHLLERAEGWMVAENERIFGTAPAGGGFALVDLDDVDSDGSDSPDSDGDHTSGAADESDADEVVNQIKALKVAELDEELKLRGLPAEGTKEQKQAALIEAVK